MFMVRREFIELHLVVSGVLILLEALTIWKAFYTD